MVTGTSALGSSGEKGPSSQISELVVVVASEVRLVKAAVKVMVYETSAGLTVVSMASQVEFSASPVVVLSYSHTTSN